MKKLACLCMIVFLGITFTGCGGSSENEINEQIVEDSLNNIREINEAQEKSDEVRELLESLR